MKLRHLLVALAAILSLTIGFGTAGSPAGADPAWAPAATAAIHPGVQMVTSGAQCTANFVYFSGSTVYLGYAAHCAGTGAATDTNGCDSGSLPLGTSVDIDNGTATGTLVYSSWLTMQSLGETDANACAYNDLALVQLNAGDVSRTNPSIPVWGGPVGVNTSGTGLGSKVYSYGNSSLRLGITLLSPKTGVSLGSGGGGWTHPVYTVTPGIPGDSGSAMLDASGKAAGVLSTIAIAPLAASNGFGDVNHEFNYARAHWNAGLTLANGTQPFNPNAIPVG